MLREYKGRYSRELRRRLSERGRRMARARWDAYHANAPKPESNMVRYFPLEFGIRVKATGETHWHDLGQCLNLGCRAALHGDSGTNLSRHARNPVTAKHQTPQ